MRQIKEEKECPGCKGTGKYTKLTFIPLKATKLIKFLRDKDNLYYDVDIFELNEKVYHLLDIIHNFESLDEYYLTNYFGENYDNPEIINNSIICLIEDIEEKGQRLLRMLNNAKVENQINET
jgi:hypothetical protein